MVFLLPPMDFGHETSNLGAFMSLDKQGLKAAASKKAWYNKNSDYVKQQAKLDLASKRRFINAVKSYPCTDCHGSWPSYVMQFDHLDASLKIGAISKIVLSKGWKTIIKEIMKCDVLCANCHALRTHKRSHLPS